MFNNYDSDYGLFSSYSSAMVAARVIAIATVVCFILAIVGAIVVYFVFLNKKNEQKFSGFIGWLYNFLHFNELLSEKILKVLYMIAAIFITLYSFVYLFFAYEGSFGVRLLVFLSMLVLGNVAIRVVYEFIIIKLIVCKNTSEINQKLSGASIKVTDSSNDNYDIADNKRDGYSSNRNYSDNRTRQNVNNVQHVDYYRSQNERQGFSKNSGNTVCYKCGKVVNKSTGVCQHCGTILS